jgi:hypothetical protein
MIRGIPIEMAGPDGTVEKPLFASARACPALLDRVKAIKRRYLDNECAERKAQIAADLLAECKPEDLDATVEAGKAAMDRAMDTMAALSAACWDFLVAGFEAAGYDHAQAERYAGLAKMEQAQEIQQKCLVGLGQVDFSPASSGKA